MVEIDGMKLVQTRCILHYIADKHHLFGKDLKERTLYGGPSWLFLLVSYDALADLQSSIEHPIYFTSCVIRVNREQNPRNVVKTS